MRSMFRSVLLVLVPVLALCAVASASAFAASPEWQLNGKAVTETTSVTIPERVLDMRWYKTLVGEQAEVSCTVSGKGTVGAKGKGSITEFKYTKCTKGNFLYCEEGTASVTALHLSWNTELQEVGREFRDRLGTGGSYAWEFQCSLAFVKKKYDIVCTHGESYPTDVYDGGEGHRGEIEAVFSGFNPRDSCKQKEEGGKETETGGAEQTGTIYFKPPVGDELAIT